MWNHLNNLTLLTFLFFRKNQWGGTEGIVKKMAAFY
jgi:hypothetical protein